MRDAVDQRAPSRDHDRKHLGGCVLRCLGIRIWNRFWGIRESVRNHETSSHDVYNRGEDIERALRSIINEAVEKKATLVEIIPGKGSGQLKKRVLRFLDQKEIKALYDRVEKDSHNFGRVFVHFRWR